MANEKLTPDAMGFTSQSKSNTTRREQENMNRVQVLSRELDFLQNLPMEPEVEPGGEVYVLLTREPVARACGSPRQKRWS